MAISIKWNTDNYVEGDVANLHILSTNKDGVVTKGPVVLTAAAVAGQMMVSDEVHSYGNKYELTVTRNDAVIGNTSLATYKERDFPGPKAIIQGDEELGYYGTFYSMLGNISDRILLSANNVSRWHKCSYKGDIVYIPAYDVTSMSSFALKEFNEIGGICLHPDADTTLRDSYGSRSVANIGKGFKRTIVFNHHDPVTGQYSFTDGVFGAMPWMFITQPGESDYPPFGYNRPPLGDTSTGTASLPVYTVMPDGLYRTTITITAAGVMSQTLGSAMAAMPATNTGTMSVRCDQFTPFWYIHISRDDSSDTE